MNTATAVQGKSEREGKKYMTKKQQFTYSWTGKRMIDIKYNFVHSLLKNVGNYEWVSFK